MAKREKLEILKDTLRIIQENRNAIKPTIIWILLILSFLAPPWVSKNRGVTYSRPTTGTGMPLQERFGARPIWACLVACPVHEITSFVVDSSRSRKSVFQLFKSYTSFSGHPRIEGTGQVIMQAAIFAHF